MTFRSCGSLQYFTFESFERIGVPHGISTRKGGQSPAPWHSLNLGRLVGDEPRRVQSNLADWLAALNRPPAGLAHLDQAHGTEVVVVSASRPPNPDTHRGDVLLTALPSITLLMRYADCVPILLFDPRNAVVGLVHAGWRGTVLGAAAQAVRRLMAEFGTRPEELLAGIGPSIGPDHYQVGPDVVAAVKRAFGPAAPRLLPIEAGRVKFDLWQANRQILEGLGVRQIEVAGLCTACHLEDWFSHRAESGCTGRFAAVIAPPVA